MTRTWTLVDTESTAVGETAGNTGCVNSDFDTFYFRTSTKIYSWVAAGTLTDIAGSYFTRNIIDICWFGGTLYALHYNPTPNPAYIVVSKWNGGTSWSLVRTLVNNVGTQALADTGYTPQIATDGTTLVAIANAGGGASSINSTTDGTTWSVDTWESAYNTSPELILHSVDSLQGWLGRYDTMVAWQDSGDDLAIPTAGNWAEQAPGLGVGDVLIGHTDSYLFFQDGGTPYTIYRTDKDDWGNTTTALATTHAARPVLVYNVGSDAIMLNLLNSANAYTWNGSDFVADGSIGSGVIRSFFRLGTTIYALSGTSGTTRFYSGGTVTPFDAAGIEYWQGTNGIGAAALSTLTITGVSGPACLATMWDQANIPVWIASDEAGDTRFVERGTSADTYATFADATSSIDHEIQALAKVTNA